MDDTGSRDQLILGSPPTSERVLATATSSVIGQTRMRLSTRRTETSSSDT